MPLFLVVVFLVNQEVSFHLSFLSLTAFSTIISTITIETVARINNYRFLIGICPRITNFFIVIDIIINDKLYII